MKFISAPRGNLDPDCYLAGDECDEDGNNCRKVHWCHNAPTTRPWKESEYDRKVQECAGGCLSQYGLANPELNKCLEACMPPKPNAMPTSTPAA
ncbi:hypothetical protein HRG_005041 [Hirsutella rhossiliensis]|uniref:Uncharacterized protein n=1 Tax=Hirsutella rhossiliensis TaxID=111463 RepID=A0A9P8MYD4_9HYPO|nr:uncharacterized protein HRG_05041 [Hirsutella rhossiliensis]KAH0964613.1 hypothetical protein HRG_05041 [Hirsutella rhossiliensis]